MFASFLSQMNYWAILVAAVAYFIIGSLWFSALFGKAWMAEIGKHGLTIKEPTKSQITTKMVLTFLYNLIAAFALAYLVFATRTFNWLAGIKLGLLCGVCFAAVGMAISFNWESRSAKLVMIDAGYAIAGIAVCGVILGAWR